MILAVLRRSRLLAGLLFAASPALGGTLLTAIHPCPVDTPWLAHHAPAAADAAMHHHGEHGAPVQGHENQTCHCIGRWLSGANVAPPKPSVESQVVLAPAPVLLPARDSSLDLAPRAALLPPATAPPLV
jgi:hypothetical protein